MEYSPETIGQWTRKGKLKNAIERLEAIQNANAATVCMFVVDGHGDHSLVKRYARISLAAGNGLLVLLKKRIERS